MILLDKILPDSIIYSLGWTIIHSLWQGALAALLLFAFITFVKSSSALKAKISVIALGLMVVSFFITFSMELATYNKEATVSAQRSELPNINPVEGRQVLPVNKSGEQNLPLFEEAAQIKNILVENISLLTMLWFAGFIIFTLRFFGGLYLTRQIKYTGTSFVPAEWQNRVNSFRYKLNISRPVRILESGKINIPIVIGYLKPVILMPVGMLTGMPASQLEAIIAHELAHIYRNDYLVNILQSAGEIILFYHPAAWWISHKIRTERENSCDDIAVSICGDKLVFAKALANLEEVKMRNRQFALAIKRSGSLTGRIKRLILGSPKEISFPEKIISLTIIAFLLLSATILASASLSPAERIIQNKYYSMNADSTWKSGKFTYNNGKMKVKMNNGKIEELFINGKKIKANNIQEYRKMVQATLDTLNFAEPKVPPPPEIAKNPPPTLSLLPPAIPLPAELPEQPPVPESAPIRTNIELPPAPPKAPKPVIAPDSTDLLRLKKEQWHLQKLRTEQEKENKKLQQTEEKMRIKEKQSQEQNREIKERSNELKVKNESFIRDLTEELIEKRIITRGEKFSMKFSNSELIINGEKQSDELLKKTKELYKKVWGKNMKDNSTFDINH